MNKDYIRTIFGKMGITVGPKEDCDIQVLDERFYQRIIRDGSLGFGESYMDGWWESRHIDEVITRLLKGNIQRYITLNVNLIIQGVLARVINFQSKLRAFRIGEAHYDIGNDLYRTMLDARMVYTCAYWRHADTLNKAQEAKLDLVCKKIGLKKGDKILDIGCGWGSFLKFASEKYGVSGVGITVSKEQATLAKELCQGLPIEIRLQDYRDINEQFDHIVSLGMIEHVGYKNYKTYMDVVNRYLKDGGLFLLQTIGSLTSGITSDPWILKYIFPNSMLPSEAQLSAASEGVFVMEDWHNFATDYDKTCMAWYKNVEKNWDTLKNTYDERFRRMWRFYLLTSAGSFRSRRNQLWQIVFSKGGVPGGYVSIR